MFVHLATNLLFTSFIIALFITIIGGVASYFKLIDTVVSKYISFLLIILFICISIIIYILFHEYYFANFQLVSVYKNSSSLVSPLVRCLAFFTDFKNSLLLFTFFLICCILIYNFIFKLNQHNKNISLSILASIIAIFCAYIFFFNNPFLENYHIKSLQGLGMNPIIFRPTIVIFIILSNLSYATIAMYFSLTLASLIAHINRPLLWEALEKWIIISMLFLVITISLYFFNIQIYKEVSVILNIKVHVKYLFINLLFIILSLISINIRKKEYLYIYMLLNIANFLTILLLFFFIQSGIITIDYYNSIVTNKAIYLLVLFFITALFSITAFSINIPHFSIIYYKKKRMLKKTSNTNIIILFFLVASVLMFSIKNIIFDILYNNINININNYSLLFKIIFLMIFILTIIMHVKLIYKSDKIYNIPKTLLFTIISSLIFTILCFTYLEYHYRYYNSIFFRIVGYIIFLSAFNLLIFTIFDLYKTIAYQINNCWHLLTKLLTITPLRKYPLFFYSAGIAILSIAFSLIINFSSNSKLSFSLNETKNNNNYSITFKQLEYKFLDNHIKQSMLFNITPKNSKKSYLADLSNNLYIISEQFLTEPKKISIGLSNIFIKPIRLYKDTLEVIIIYRHFIYLALLGVIIIIIGIIIRIFSKPFLHKEFEIIQSNKYKYHLK